MDEYSVTLSHSEETFSVKPNEIILEAALRQGVTIPYVCRNGTCRTCIFQVAEGDVQQLDAEECSISALELQSNLRLVCLSICKSDVLLEKVEKRPRNNIIAV